MIDWTKQMPTLCISRGISSGIFWTPGWEINLEANSDVTATLDAFLASVERRAYRMALITAGNREDALDAVQDAMLNLATRYASRPAAEWAPLFYRILQSRLRDQRRRRVVRDRFRAILWRAEPDDDRDPIQELPDPAALTPDREVAGGRAGEAIEKALALLPLRQQQAFLLRVWEGLDVAQTASAMGCSEGSVKTHLSRATQALRERLSDHAP
jgi:RNA polymerase sigma-70 factor (ECF subfamily)